MTQAEAGKEFAGHETDIETTCPGLAALGRQRRPQDEQPAGLDRPLRPDAGPRSQDPSQDPAAVRHRRRSRPQQRPRRCHVPPQHRSGRHSEREARGGDRPHHAPRKCGRRASSGRSHPVSRSPRDERWGRTYEGYSEDPALVAELGAAAVRGMQGDDLKDPLRVLACAKHYVGDGGTAWGTGTVPVGGNRAPLDQGDTRVDEADAPQDPHARISHHDRCRRGVDHAFLQQLERREALGPQTALDRHPEGGARVRGLPDLGLQRDRPVARRLPERCSRLDQRRHGHGHGAEPSTRNSSPRSRAWSRRAMCRPPESTMP